MRKFFLSTAFLAGAVSGASGTAWAAPNLIVNGSFESFTQGAFMGWTNAGSLGSTPAQYAVPHPTDGSTPGQFGDVVSADPFAFSPDRAGVQSAYFVADEAVQTLSQQVALVAGQIYEVGFDLFTTLSGARNQNPFTLTGSIGSLVVTTATAANTTPGVWRHYSSTFVAPSASETFTFAFSSGAGPAKDVIADLVYVGAPLTPVPEPASLAAFACGLLGLGMARRRA